MPSSRRTWTMPSASIDRRRSVALAGVEARVGRPRRARGRRRPRSARAGSRSPGSDDLDACAGRRPRWRAPPAPAPARPAGTAASTTRAGRPRRLAVDRPRLAVGRQRRGVSRAPIGGHGDEGEQAAVDDDPLDAGAAEAGPGRRSRRRRRRRRAARSGRRRRRRGRGRRRRGTSAGAAGPGSACAGQHRQERSGRQHPDDEPDVLLGEQVAEGPERVAHHLDEDVEAAVAVGGERARGDEPGRPSGAWMRRGRCRSRPARRRRPGADAALAARR